MIFSYIVQDSSGQMRTGTSSAPNARVLRERLLEQGFTITRITQRTPLRWRISILPPFLWREEIK